MFQAARGIMNWLGDCAKVPAIVSYFSFDIFITLFSIASILEPCLGSFSVSRHRDLTFLQLIAVVEGCEKSFGVSFFLLL